jgi:hypothetical protein
MQSYFALLTQTESQIGESLRQCLFKKGDDGDDKVGDGEVADAAFDEQHSEVTVETCSSIEVDKDSSCGELVLVVVTSKG